MKKLAICSLAIILMVACQEQKPERWTNNSPEIDVVKALLADYEAGNWDAWKGHYADTAKLYHNTTEPSGIDETLEALKGYLEPVSQYSFSDKDIYYEMIIDDKDEKWVNFWATWEGTVDALERDLKIPVHLTLQFVDGKIVEEHGFYNMVDYMIAMNDIAAMAEEEEGESDE